MECPERDCDPTEPGAAEEVVGKSWMAVVDDRY
jgi:hypothetical protein